MDGVMGGVDGSSCVVAQRVPWGSQWLVLTNGATYLLHCWYIDYIYIVLVNIKNC